MEHQKTKTDLFEEMYKHEGDEKPLKKEIKSTVREVFEHSTFPGLSNIMRSIWPIKLTWIFSHICLFAIATYLVINNIINYLNFDVITQVREINQFPMEFPTVTLCNLNFCQTEYCLNISMPYIVNASTLKSNKEELQKIGYPIDQMIFSCHFNSFDCGNFKWFYHYLYGNCYQFNSGLDDNNQPRSIEVTTQSGMMGGLQLFAFVGIPSNVMNKITYANFGLVVFVHTNTTSPLSLQPVTVSPNTEANIAVSNLIAQRQPQPYSTCQSLDGFKSELVDIILAQGYDYQQTDCIGLCRQWLLIKYCNCIHYKFPFADYFYSVNSCGFDMPGSHSCPDSILYNFTKFEFVESECLPYCPLECDSSQYEMSLSFDYFPSPKQAASLLLGSPTNISSLFNSTNFALPEFSQNIVSLNVYFDSLSYTQIIETPALDVISLFSNIGGSIGLMLGVSLATFVELIELTVHIMYVVLTYGKSKGTYNTENSSKGKNANGEVRNEIDEIQMQVSVVNHIDHQMNRNQPEIIDRIMEKLIKLDERFENLDKKNVDFDNLNERITKIEEKLTQVSF